MLVKQYNTHMMSDRSALDTLIHTNSVSIEVSSLAPYIAPLMFNSMPISILSSLVRMILMNCNLSALLFDNTSIGQKRKYSVTSIVGQTQSQLNPTFLEVNWSETKCWENSIY